MSVFSEPNRDAYVTPIDNASTGPKLGFLGAFEAAYDAQARTSSLFGLEAAFREQEQEQIRAIRAAGGTPPKSLNESEDGALGGFTGGINSKRYMQAARYFTDGKDEDGIGGVIAQRETELAEVAGRHPDLQLKNLREVFDTTREKAQRAERRWNDAPTSVGGDIGGFVGGVLAGVDPRTDPLNFATMPVAAGRTALARIGVQAGAQGLTEGFNQFIGVQENRRLLGLESGFGSAALAVGGAAVGGAALQGAGEALALGVKRWFRNAPNDPAPPPPQSDARPATGEVLGPPEQSAFAEAPIVERRNLLEDFDTFAEEVAKGSPLGKSRRAEALVRGDVGHFTTQLDDFQGPKPWEVPPRTDTAAAPYPTTAKIDKPFQRFTDSLDTVDDLARRADPETFRIFDKLAEQSARLRGWLEDLNTGRTDAVAESVKALDADIARTEAKLAKASAKNQRRLETELDGLRAQRQEQVEQVGGVDTPDQATVRQRLVKLDEDMRDLAPAVSRAVAQAEGEWRVTGPSTDALRILKDLETRAAAPFRPERSAAEPTVERQIGTTVDLTGALDVTLPPARPLVRSIAEDLPVLNSRPDITASLPANADAADRLSAIVAAEAKIVDAQLDEFRSGVARFMEAEDGKLTFPNGRQLDLDRDFILVPVTDGEGSQKMSLRSFLKDVVDDENAFRAVGTCSTGRTS